MVKSNRLNSIRGLKVLITAGPTREYWDPVRYLSNASSGMMGIMLAHEASALGAQVTLVVGPVPGSIPRSHTSSASMEYDPASRKTGARGNGIQVVPVVTAEEMDAAVQENLIDTQVFIGAAAVSDYRPAEMSKSKIKDRSPSVTLRLVRNDDIIAKVAQRTPKRPAIVIGFALETHDLLKHAQEKLQQKGLDWIVANQETNIGRKKGSATLLSRWGEKIPLGTMSKKKLARKIWEALLKRPAL